MDYEVVNLSKRYLNDEQLSECALCGEPVTTEYEPVIFVARGHYCLAHTCCLDIVKEAGGL